jgi:hypothetical protein
LLGQLVESGLVARLDMKGLRTRVLRRQSLRERGGGGADQAAPSEHVERPGALADEVRRRLQAGAPADAAAGEERDRASA